MKMQLQMQEPQANNTRALVGGRQATILVPISSYLTSCRNKQQQQQRKNQTKSEHISQTRRNLLPASQISEKHEKENCDLKQTQLLYAEMPCFSSTRRGRHNTAKSDEYYNNNDDDNDGRNNNREQSQITGPTGSVRGRKNVVRKSIEGLKDVSRKLKKRLSSSSRSPTPTTSLNGSSSDINNNASDCNVNHTHLAFKRELNEKLAQKLSRQASDEQQQQQQQKKQPTTSSLLLSSPASSSSSSLSVVSSPGFVSMSPSTKFSENSKSQSDQLQSSSMLANSQSTKPLTLTTATNNTITNKNKTPILQQTSTDDTLYKPTPISSRKVNITKQPLNALSTTLKLSNALVVFVTSLSVIRKTYNESRQVLSLLELNLMQYDERDIFVFEDCKRQLIALCGEIRVPSIYVNGKYFGGLKELEKLNEIGELQTIWSEFKLDANDCTLDGVRRLQQSSGQRKVCACCGNAKYILCQACDGSQKSTIRHYNSNSIALKCTKCVANVGLVQCPVCNSQSQKQKS